MTFWAIQTLNGVSFGMLLFLLAAGLSLIFGLMPSPNLMAAAIAQRTKRIKIGVFGNLAALHAHPVRLAEETAMLDVMSGGRLISGFVRGVPQEYLALSVPLSQARERLNEAWDLIVKAWTTHEPFD